MIQWVFVGLKKLNGVRCKEKGQDNRCLQLAKND